MLAGETNLAKKLNATPVLKANPNLCVVFELEAFEEHETTQLISDLNSISVEKVTALFDPQKLNYFWQLCQGNPGELSAQLKRWNDETGGTNEPLALTTGKPKRQYILSGVYFIFALALAFALVYQDEINEVITPDISNVETTPFKKIEPEKDVTGEPEIASSLKTSGITNKPNESLNAAESKEIIKHEEIVQTQDVKSILKEKNAESVIAKDVDKKAVESNSMDTSEQKRSIDDIAAKDVTKFELTKDEEKLMGINNKLFTLQWMGVSSYQSALAFKNKHPQSESMLIFRRKLQNRFLFILVSGQYNSRIDADNTKTIYQNRGYPGEPWIKSIKAVQSEITELTK